MTQRRTAAQAITDEVAEARRIRDAVRMVDTSATCLWCQCESSAHTDQDSDDLAPHHAYGAMIPSTDRAVEVRVPGMWVGLVCGRCVDAGHVAC